MAIFTKKHLNIIVVTLFLAVLIFTGCSKTEEIPQADKYWQKKYVDYPTKLKVEKNNIIKYIDELSSEKYEGRKTGTKGETEAALYLASFLKNLDISPYNKGNYFQIFTDSSSGIEGENVLGILKSPERHKYIILSANYDHIGKETNGRERIYPGANMNASGVSAVMEMARIFSKNFDQMDYNVVFAFWSGHEQNLAGSKAYIDSLSQMEKENIYLMLNLDTIGAIGEKDYIIWRENDQVLDIIKEINDWRNLSMKVAARGADNSDHYYFGVENIPAVTIRSKSWAPGSKTIGDTRYGVNIDNVRVLTQNLINFVFNLKGEENVR